MECNKEINLWYSPSSYFIVSQGCSIFSAVRHGIRYILHYLELINHEESGPYAMLQEASNHSYHYHHYISNNNWIKQKIKFEDRWIAHRVQRKEKGLIPPHQKRNGRRGTSESTPRISPCTYAIYGPQLRCFCRVSINPSWLHCFADATLWKTIGKTKIFYCGEESTHYTKDIKAADVTVKPTWKAAVRKFKSLSIIKVKILCPYFTSIKVLWYFLQLAKGWSSG